MNGYYDYKKFAILYVDNEERSLKQLAMAFEKKFRILTATNAADGFRLLEEHQDEIAILLTDERMPGERGVKLLEKARLAHPRIVRILVTAYADYDATVAAVNSGAIYKYVSKPWEPANFEQVLRRAIEFFIVQRERDQLLREKLATLHKLVVADCIISLGVLAMGLSHHLRNALVAVRTFIDLAPIHQFHAHADLEKMRNPKFWTEFHELVQQQVERIVRLLSDLDLAQARPPYVFKDRVRLRQMVEASLDRMRSRLEEKQIMVENLVPDDLPMVLVDQAKIERVFDLLFEDETVCLPEGGRICLRAQAPPADNDQEAEVRMEIQDNGPGLPAEELRSVFDPFYIRIEEPHEFGINLMACYFLVYHHGGRIEVRSKEGHGTTFLLTLPVNPQARPTYPPEKEFLAKVLMNEALWERLLARD